MTKILVVLIAAVIFAGFAAANIDDYAPGWNTETASTGVPSGYSPGVSSNDLARTLFTP